MKIPEIKTLDDSTIMNQLTLLTENINFPYGKVFVERTKESLEIEEIVHRIKARDIHLSHYINAVCNHLLGQITQKQEANKIIEGIVRRLLVLVEQKTADMAKENELLKKELKFIKEEHNFLKKEIAGTLSTLRIEVTPPEEPEEEPKKGRF